ncbi:MAG: esterase family protein [Candidatus Marinimicrobia bacterium]|nr:esterase family protein [Candidatus Neomarinimicrobiota bacterium]MBL7067158.1 esterase family protein [Candidatus Neomarinimicrobiota bacterium]
MSLNKRIIPGFVALLFFISALQAASLDTVVIKSKAMQKKPKAVIVLPDAYQNSKSGFPVLYLLHGWSGAYDNWSKKMDLGPLSDRYSIIIVCPDGGYAGWYLDSPLKKDSQYETYISGEVLRYIDKHYRTIEDTDGRFICGISMGGHGAISLLAKHPDLYAAAGSMSGVMALTSSSKHFGIGQLIGDYETHRDKWEQYSCLNMIENLAGLDKGIVIDCGIADFTIDINRQMHRKLMELGIPHDYYERPGEHSWDYWTNALEYHIMYFIKFRDRYLNSENRP